jgi:hypothetical protein
LGGLLAGALADLTTAPFAIASGGLAVAAFVIGPVMLTRELSHLGTQRREAAANTLPNPACQRSCPSTTPN